MVSRKLSKLDFFQKKNGHKLHVVPFPVDPEESSLHSILVNTVMDFGKKRKKSDKMREIRDKAVSLQRPKLGK